MGALGNESMPFPGYIFGFIYAVFGFIYFFPIYYLFKFSTNMKEALLHSNEENIDEAFINLKSHYKFMGIFTIVFISIYLLLGLGALFVGLSF